MGSSVFHLSGINGLRSIAAVIVVISHALGKGHLIGLPVFKNNYVLAGHGVTVFFVVSGFLITYLLLLEKEDKQKINIRSFYIRRILRIWPLYYFYLVISIFVTWYFVPSDINGMLPLYFVICANIPFIAGMSLPLSAHYWSLGVEEQFYLFWPWILGRLKRLETFLIIFIAIFFLLKLIAWLYLMQTNIVWPYVTMEVCRFQCMAIGGLAALWAHKKNKLFLILTKARLVEVAVWVSILLIAIGKFPYPFYIGPELVACISVILIMNISAARRKIISLDAAVFDFIGKISYGIYVYHPLVIFFVLKFLSPYVVNASSLEKYIFLLSSVLGLTILIAWLSFVLLEQRFLRLKDRFTIIQSRNSL